MPVIPSSWDGRVETKHCSLVEDSGQTWLKFWSRRTSPYFAPHADRNSRLLGPTTTLLSFHTWETCLQDASYSLLVLIHTNYVNFLLFFNSYGSISTRSLSAGTKDAKPAKIPCVLT